LHLNFKYVVALAFSLSTLANADGNHIVKWVDSQGVTHYGDKLPSQETGRNNTEISKQGIVVKRNVKTESTATDEMANEEKLAAQRKDNILLSSYTKAEEIDLARDRNLQLDQASLQALSVQRENVVGRMTRNQATAKNFIDRKKPVPPYLQDELKIAQAELTKIDKQVAERKLSMDETRKRFDADKARFMALKQSSSALAPVASLPGKP
jgi:hypothetical protein